MTNNYENETSNSNTFIPITTNTNGISYFSDENIMLKQGFYSDSNSGKMTISFCIAETDPVSGKNKYPKNKRQNIMLDAEKAAAFEDIINTLFIPKYTNGESCSYGIFLNARKDSLLELCLDANKTIALRYSMGINENRIPANIFYFPFKKMMIVKNYNPENGDCDVDEIDGLFLVFLKSLRAFNDANSSAYAHFEKHANKWSNDQIIKQVGEIAIKLGLAPSISGFNNTSKPAVQSGFNTNFNNNSPVPTIEQVENLEDILNQDIL